MNVIGIPDIIVAVPYFLLLLGALSPIVIKVILGNREPSNLLASIQASGFSILTAVALIIVYKLLLGRENFFAFNQLVQIDRQAVLGGVSLMLLVGLGVFYLKDNVSTKGKGFAELVFLLMSASLGMLLVIQAADLMTLFIGLELMSLPVYVVIALGHDEFLSKESAMKYFILGGLSSACFLMGMALLYGATGTSSFAAWEGLLAQVTGQSKLAFLGSILLLTGLLFKVSLFPLHLWTADVYQGAPTGVTAIMASAVKLASMLAVLRVFRLGFIEGSDFWIQILQWITALTILVGNSAALLSTNLKRILAFSSVAHSGYLFLGVLALVLANPDQRLAIENHFMFYLITYSFASLALFGWISSLEKKVGAQLTLDDMRGLAESRPFEAWVATFLLLSLAGIPPMVGFFAKAYLIVSALDQGLLWLSLWSIVGSVVGVYYYLRPSVLMFMQAKTESDSALNQDARFSIFWSALIAVLVLVLGVWHGPLIQFMGQLP